MRIIIVISFLSKLLGCAANHVAERNIPSDNLYAYSADEIRSEAKRSGLVSPLPLLARRNASGTMVFVGESTEQKDGKYIALRGPMLPVKIVSIPVTTPYLHWFPDNDGNLVAWYKSGDTMLTFASGQKIAFDSPLTGNCQFDDSGQYFCIVKRGEKEPQFETNIYSVRNPKEPLLSFRSDFYPYRLYWQHDRLFLTGDTRIEGDEKQKVWICSIYDGTCRVERELNISGTRILDMDPWSSWILVQHQTVVSSVEVAPVIRYKHFLYNIVDGARIDLPSQRNDNVLHRPALLFFLKEDLLARK